jgi:hypothetical protein
MSCTLEARLVEIGYEGELCELLHCVSATACSAVRQIQADAVVCRLPKPFLATEGYGTALYHGIAWAAGAGDLPCRQAAAASVPGRLASICVE